MTVIHSHRGIPRRRPWFWDDYVTGDGVWTAGWPAYGKPPEGEDLARLRAGLGREVGSLAAMWQYYRVIIDDELARHGDVSYAQQAEHDALGLFALHQQSQASPMHQRGVHIGTALLRLRLSDRYRENPDALDRRVSATVSATSPAALLTRLRGLITQLRTARPALPLDYTQLVEDLYDWYWPERRNSVRRRWGARYFEWSAPEKAPTKTTTADPASPSPADR